MTESRLPFFGRIIRRMEQIRNISRMVKLVKEVGEEKENENPAHIVTSRSNYGSWHVTSGPLRDRYIEKYKKTTDLDVNGILVDAIKNDYLDRNKIKEGNLELDTVFVTTKGRKLIGKPFGFLEELLGQFPYSVSLFTGGALLALGIFIWRLIKYIIN